MRFPFPLHQVGQERSAAKTAALLRRAWQARGTGPGIRSIVEVSAKVSTNQVFRLELSDHSTAIAKLSGYGSYHYFRDDHDRLRLLVDGLRGSEYENFLASAYPDERGHSFTYCEGDLWLIFYHDMPTRQFLPRVLGPAQIESLAQNMAAFHLACDRAAREIPPSAQSLQSEVVYLLDLLRDRHSRRQFRLGRSERAGLERHCERFLENLDRVRYAYWPRVPLLVDWNRGNFSVDYGEAAPDSDAPFRFFSRWDYDWFRIESPVLDFYFCARLSSAAGDQSEFTYTPHPFFEDGFARFLREYHRARPLGASEVLFIKEAYRFFVLRYVFLSGEHFFRPVYCARLRRAALVEDLPALDRLDFRRLLDQL